MQTNPRLKWVFGTGMAVCLVAVAAIAFLSGPMKIIVGAAVAIGMLVIYTRVLSGALTPQRKPIELYVDENGIYADNAPLALRSDIAKAYIRPARGARTSRHTNYGGSVPYSYQLNLPSYPLTVELIVRRHGQVNIDPGGEGPAAAILTALGFAVTTCSPDYVARTRGQRTSSIVVMAAAVVLFVGYYLYMSHPH